MGCVMVSILQVAALFALPFFLTARAKSSRSVHVPVVDLPPPENKYTVDEFFEPPSHTVHAPAVTALAAAF